MSKFMYLKVDGTRYSAVPELSAVSELEALPRFFLTRVLPVEDRIEFLLGIFGLSARLVEDILADLLKRNLIALRLEAGRVEILKEPPVRRRRRSGKPIEIWQDDFTGALLPLSAAKLHAEAPKDPSTITNYLQAQTDESTAFLSLADSRILAMLASVDPTMRVATDGLLPESLREKERLESFPIYLPVVAAKVDANEVPFVDAPRIPYWLTRLWSRELVQGDRVKLAALEEAMASGLLDVARRAPSSGERYANFDNLEAADLSYLVKRWAFGVDDVLDADSDVRTLLNRLHQADLRLDTIEAQLSCRGTVSLVERPALSHLTEMWRQTVRTLVVVSGDWSAELLQRVAAATVNASDHDAHLILVECSDKPRSRPMLSIRETFLKTSSGDVEFLSIKAPAHLDMCISDGRQARLGSLKNILLSTGPAVSVSGAGPVETLRAPIVRNIDTREVGQWFLARIQDTASPQSVPEPEAADGLKPAEDGLAARLEILRDEMAFFHEDLRNRIYLLEDERKRARARREGSETGVPDEQKRLRDIEPSFGEKRDEILQFWEGLEVPIPQVIDSPQETFSHFCRRVSAPDRVHELEIFLSNIPAESTQAVGRALSRVLTNRTRIVLNLTHPASNKSLTRVRNLYPEVLNNSLFSLHIVQAQLPNILIADAAFVGLTSGNWFRDTESDHYGFLVHSPAFAQSLLDFAKQKRAAAPNIASGVDEGE